MPGNINIASGSEVTYTRVNPVTYGSSSGPSTGNSMDIYPGAFYEFGTLDFLYIYEKGYVDKTFQEYMFEFTANADNMSLRITSQHTLHWPVVPEFKAGHRYQISSLNGIVLFAEVAE